jgi:hypothetical protein
MLDPSALGRRGPRGQDAQLHHKGPNGRERRLGVGHGRALVMPPWVDDICCLSYVLYSISLTLVSHFVLHGFDESPMAPLIPQA